MIDLRVMWLILHIEFGRFQNENASATSPIGFNGAATRPISSADGIKMRAEANRRSNVYHAIVCADEMPGSIGS